jgi:phosphoglycerate dehydrogenase-like enzyme
MAKLRGLYLLDDAAFPMIYGSDEQRDIAQIIDFVGPRQTRASLPAHKHLLRDMDVLFSGWGCVVVDEAFLDAAPNLKAIFYGAGAVGSWMTDAVWERGVLVTSAYAANAVPVAEYTMASIVMALKQAWSLARQTRQQRVFVPRDGAPGCYGSTVGLVSLGMIGRTLLNLLQPFDLHVMAYDPFLSEAEMARMGVTKVSLEQLFLRSDVVSVHTPDLPETEGMITGEMINSMRSGATFINTARGQVVREAEMVDVLRQRPDLQAVLDVTWPEPPPTGSPLYTLENVFLTPHIAGSVGRECRRMGRYMVEELERYITGKPLKWLISPEVALRSSHRPQQSIRRPPLAAAAI